MMLLCAAAVLSIILNTATASPEHRGSAWIEGFSILMAVFIVVNVTAINDFQKEKQFRKLNAKKSDRLLKVQRGGTTVTVSIHDIVVGDVVHVETGEVIPADGILIQGHNIRVDESAATGESDAVKKNLDSDPFFLAGTKVMEGVGTIMIINVGESSFEGKVMMALRGEAESTPLEIKLDALAENIGKLGLAAAIFVVVALIIKHVAIMVTNHRSFGWSDVQGFVGYFVVAITIVVVAVPEGLPLSVTIALAYSMLKMIEDNNLVRVLAACETMGSATQICSDKTGTLTQNKMTAVRGMVGQFEFDSPNWDGTGAVDISKVLFIEGVEINSTAAEAVDSTSGKTGFVGNKTEAALLQLSRKLGGDYVATRNQLNVIQVYPFSSKQKMMGTVIQAPEGFRLHIKGASEIILEACVHHISEKGKVQNLTLDHRTKYSALIEKFASNGLRTIGVAYSDIPRELNWDAGIPKEGLTLIGIVGIMDPLRPEVVNAVKDCQNAGITVRMVTGDNAITARHIAIEAGILDPKDGIVMEGPVFRNLSDADLDSTIPRLQVLARSSPLDKQILVQKLKSMGEVVAVTGDGTNDAPALKMANIGFSMGIAGTEVAKEASQIILMDDNFASIVKAVMWGRNVFDSIRKFLQFQLTVNIVAVSVAVIGSLSSGKGESPLKPVQLLWVNLIMDTLAALALATEPPTRALLDRMPNGMHAPLITRVMWLHILGQAAYQLIVTLALLYKGAAWLGVESESLLHNTILFNTFVFCQVFNEINCRRINQELNVFEGFFRNKVFISVMIGTLIVQFLFVEFGGGFAGTTQLSSAQWLMCILVGFVSLPIGFVLRLVPISLFGGGDNIDPVEAEITLEMSNLAAIRSKVHEEHPEVSSAPVASTSQTPGISITPADAFANERVTGGRSRAGSDAYLSAMLGGGVDGSGMKTSRSFETLNEMGRSRSGSVSAGLNTHAHPHTHATDGSGIIRSDSYELRRLKARSNWTGIVEKLRWQRRVVSVFESIHRPIEQRRHVDDSIPTVQEKFRGAVNKINSQRRVVNAFQQSVKSPASQSFADVVDKAKTTH